VLPEEDIEVKVSNFFTRIKEPAITNLKLEFSGDVRTSKMYPSELPDLFRGDQLVLAGRYSGSGEVEAKRTGIVAGQERSFTEKVRFAGENTEQDFIPRLWATRRVGFLLDEIRLHGENAELRDEVASLAREYGIVTPYTAYLIIEDETRRNVPLAQQSLPQMNSDKKALESAKDAYGKFQNEKDGAGGVANAQGQNQLKYALQSSLSTSREASAQQLGGYAAAAPASKAEAGRIAQYTQQTKFVNGRAFFQNGNQWVDGKAQGLTKRQKVQFNSPEYFDLIAKNPEAAQWLSLGKNMLLAINDTVYEITE
jgi:Ca-activated chloride channel family protein